MKKNKKVAKPLTAAQIAHNKFLTRMGVSPKQVKERKRAEKLAKEGNGPNLIYDTIDSVRKGYDD